MLGLKDNGPSNRPDPRSLDKLSVLFRQPDKSTLLPLVVYYFFNAAFNNITSASIVNYIVMRE